MRCPSLVDLALLKRADEQSCAASMEPTHRGWHATNLTANQTKGALATIICIWRGGCGKRVRPYSQHRLCNAHRKLLLAREKHGLPWSANLYTHRLNRCAAQPCPRKARETLCKYHSRKQRGRKRVGQIEAAD